MIGITASGGLARYRLGRSKFPHTLQPSPDLGGRKEEIPRPLIAYLGPDESAGWPLVLCPFVQLGCSSTGGQLQTL